MDNQQSSSTSGLEGQLRNMILNNSETSKSSEDGRPIIDDSAHFASSRAKNSLNLNDNTRKEEDYPSLGDAKAKQEPKTPPQRRNQRPSQRERRNPNSGFSIDIDPRAQAPPLHSTPHRQGQRGFSEHYPTRSFQPDHNPHRPARHQGRGGYDHRAQGSWHGSTHGSSHHHASRPSESDWRGSRHQPVQSFSAHPGPSYENPRNQVRHEDPLKAVELLDNLAREVIFNSEIEITEIAEKEAFRRIVENLSQKAVAQYEVETRNNTNFPFASVELKCFGSMSSGFATKASDMDLGLISPFSNPAPEEKGSPIPRILEKILLDEGYGARLLTKTRVPIIKLCQNPPEDLYHELIEARQKWEQEELEGPNTAPEIEDNRPKNQEDAADQSHGEDEDSTPFNCFEVPVGDQGTMQVFHLQQDTKSVGAYYALAKRVLRKAGGRDVTFTNYNELSEQEWIVLGRFCEAFVLGLKDSTIRQRLARYPSLSFPNTGLCSLLGVSIQTEGEIIVQNWENSSIKRIVDAQMNEWTTPMKYWRNLLWKDPSTTDPSQFAKDLQFQLEKVKRISSVQLSMLEQLPHESPTLYFSRTQEIVANLRRTCTDLSKPLQIEIAEVYVSGIHQDSIKQQVSEEWTQNLEAWDLGVVARRHASLHLAWELEKALEKLLYQENLVEIIKDYIAILRQPFQQLQPNFFAVVIPPEQANILATIRTIQDPHLLTPNQPKDKYKDNLEFPKTGAGVQCDINFSAHLALHNTQLLRCYSLTDPRVREMVLFIKHWAKKRGINSGYRGTLSSYGYVLMVLHFLVNVARPFVCPNLQQLAPPLPPNMPPADIERFTMCQGYNVHFWRNEPEIENLAQTKQLNWNQESTGSLLRGFFEYYAQGGMMSNGSGRGFDWGREVISLRTQGGILSKQSKGWTEAKTIVETTAATADNANLMQQPVQNSSVGQEAAKPKGEVKEVRLRYLFAIEDPFEVDHNVARTVTHNGIVSIRDEFRRAWRILKVAGHGNVQENLLDDLADQDDGAVPFLKVLDDIHGINQ